jgi:hypothetical protein
MGIRGTRCTADNFMNYVVFEIQFPEWNNL